jgi:hypothetical protein
MKLSESSFDILENFSHINQEIYIPKGNTILCASPEHHVIAEATLEDAFDDEFYLYDLTSFLGVLKLIKDAEIKIEKDFVHISSLEEEVMYRTADPITLRVVKKRGKIPEDGAFSKITLTKDELKRISKVSASLKLDDLCIRTDKENNVEVVIHQRSESHKHQFTKKTSVKSNKPFQVYISIQYLDLLDGDYELTVLDDRIIFRNTTCKVTYWIASTLLPSHAKKNK